MITRRTFVAAAAAALAAAPRFAFAQQESVPRFALVHNSFPVEILTESGGNASIGALLREMRRLGHVEGENLIIERWSGAGRDGDGYAAYAREIVATNPDVIRANAFRLISALKTATNTIPIVFIATDPLGHGLVPNLARPGGNVTGFSVDGGAEFEAKRLELLHMMAPAARRIAYLIPQSLWDVGPMAVAARTGAEILGLELVPAVLDSPIDPAAYERAFARMVLDRAEAVLTSNIGENYAPANVAKIVELAEIARLPAMYLSRNQVAAGGLMSYAANFSDIGTRMGGYVHRILEGENPGDLPIQQAKKFDLIINMKTADALGLTLPPSLMIRATEFIE